MGPEDIDALRFLWRVWLTIALRISPADLTPPWPAGTTVRYPKVDPHDPQRLSNVHFLRIAENLTAANTASKTSRLGWHREGTDECSPSPFTRARHPRQPSAPERYRRSAASNRDMPPRSPRLRRHVLREVPPQFAGRAPHGQLPSSVAANELDGAA